jgi:hypothetical protein
MVRNICKSLMALGAGVAMLAAAPATAATLYEFYNSSGAYVGHAVVDDNGAVCDQEGPWGSVATVRTTNIGSYLCP